MELSTAVVSITRTARGRYFWAAWWTGIPSYAPFRKPDASDGGAATPEAALADAQKKSGRHLSPTSPYWARAVNRMLRGERPPPPPQDKPRPSPSPPAVRSAWDVLGIERGASIEQIRRAHRLQALATHPDRGGDAAAFREVQEAYERLLRKNKKR